MTSMHRVGYGVVKTLLVLGVLALPRARLRHHDPSIAVIGVTIVLCSLAYALLQGSDPGYLTESLLRDAMKRDDDDGHLLTTEKEEDDDEVVGLHEDELQSPARQAEKVYRLRRIQQIQSALQAPTQAKSKSDDDEDDDFDREIDEMQLALEQQPLTQHPSDTEPGQTLDAFCVDCSLFPPLRARHCRACQRCVATFDHHCYLIGTCIGEKNHARFWYFLLFQSIELLLGVLVVTAPKSSWMHANGWPLFLLFILALLLLFVGAMLAFHTFLAMSSMTTYEFGRGTDKITYLRGFRECDLPFSRGLGANLAFFCCPLRPLTGRLRAPRGDLKTPQRQCGELAWLPTLWKPPTPILDRDSDKICENLWENKYYSCC